MTVHAVFVLGAISGPCVRCSGCDSLFSSLMLLEHHKEEFEHWSDYEDDGRLPCCRRNRRDDDDYTDTDSGSSDAESEDLERLL
uniref:C2H2-type domain-containing protein n=1 Tax=Anopheles dirus TaxID=7168 RepID=A0A182MZP7_9DIPT